jgi:hypothetical protein
MTKKKTKNKKQSKRRPVMGAAPQMAEAVDISPAA